jgi:hypothetical protein
LLRGGTRGSYNAVLTRNANNQYVLSYEDANDVVNTLPPANSLDALSSAMRNSGDFSQSAIDAVRAQAALMPAVVFDKTGTTDSILGTISTSATNFYVSPTAANYNVVKDIYVLLGIREYEFAGDPLFKIIRETYERLLVSLNEPLARKVFNDTRTQHTTPALSQVQINALTVQR